VRRPHHLTPRERNTLPAGRPSSEEEPRSVAS
jgi:hypothetical protein